MTRAPQSGIHVEQWMVPLILGMVARGDRRHDIAAWFGINQGRIKEVEDGEFGTPALAKPNQLPPSGSPGPKARQIREAVHKAINILGTASSSEANAAEKILRASADMFDRNE